MGKSLPQQATEMADNECPRSDGNTSELDTGQERQCAAISGVRHWKPALANIFPEYS